MKCTLGIVKVRTELTCVEVNEDLIFSVFFTFQESLFLILNTRSPRSIKIKLLLQQILIHEVYNVSQNMPLGQCHES